MQYHIKFISIYFFHFQIASHWIVTLHLFGKSLSSKQVNYSYKKLMHPPELWGGTWNATNPATRVTIAILDIQSLLSFSKIMWVSYELKLLQHHVGMSSWLCDLVVWFWWQLTIACCSCWVDMITFSHLPQWIHTYNQTMKVLIVLIEYTFRFQVKFQRYIKIQGTSKPERDEEKFLLIIFFSHGTIF